MSKWSPVDALEGIKKRSVGYSNYRNDSRQVRRRGMVRCPLHFKSLYTEPHL